MTVSHDLGFGRFAHFQAESDVSPDREMGKQRIVLEHHSDVAPMRRNSCDVRTGQRDIASIGRHKSGNDSKQCGLAAAGRTEQRYELRAFDRDVEFVQDHSVSIALADLDRA